jgi:hypothetical protein
MDGHDSDVHTWKIQYGELYKVCIGEYEFIYRRLTIAEHRRIVATSQGDCELEDNIVREVLLYPDYQDIADDSPAMVLTVLSGHILESSLLGARVRKYDPRNPPAANGQDISTKWEEYLEGRRKELTPRKDKATGRPIVDDPIMPLIIGITNAFESYKPEELMELPMHDLLDRVAWAELKVGALQGDSGRQSPRSMPQGLSGPQRQSHLEDMSVAASNRALQEEMRKARARTGS